MGAKTFRTPITVHDGKQYVPPGTEITLDEADADRFIAQHGEYGGANVPQDPGNTQTINAMDKASLDSLNTFAEIHGGHGEDAPSLNKRKPAVAATVALENDDDELPSDVDLDAMSKDELIALAEDRKVELAHGATKADIKAALKK